MESTKGTDYDVVVIGGAYSGATTALLIKRWMPSARVLVVERAAAFDQKVGEATVEVSAMFLHRVLGMYDELVRTHLPKHGLRYWFYDRPDRDLSEMSEVGPDEVPRMPAFQLDRAKLDEHVLELAERAGAEVLRPARVTSVELGWPSSRVRCEGDKGVREVTCRWVVDASGRATFLSRKLGLYRQTKELPTAAAWGRWKNVRDMDGTDVMGTDPRAPRLPKIDASRRLGTNHFCGYGWWCWLIPLGGGETSVGVVWDKTRFSMPEGSAVESYREFLRTHPGLRELTEGATLDETDFRGYGHLPYRSTKYMEPGWALVGDAGSFLDPYYSPGLDHASMSAYATARVLEEDLAKHCSPAALDELVRAHNGKFERHYDRTLEALYVDKYELMGDAELTAAAFLLDTALYYLGVVVPAHEDMELFAMPQFGSTHPAAEGVFRLMQLYRRRLVAIAKRRRALGTYGKRNVGWRLFLGDVGLGASAVKKLVKGLRFWGELELDALRGRPAPPREASRSESAPRSLRSVPARP